MKNASTQGKRQRDLAAAFKAETFRYLEAVFRDACCLADNRDEAAELVVRAYVRAFLRYEAFRRGRTQKAVDWLHANLCAVFCDEILTRASRSRMIGG